MPAGPAEAGCTEGRGIHTSGSSGHSAGCGAGVESQKQKTRFAQEGAGPRPASGRAMVLGGSGAARRSCSRPPQESHCWLALGSSRKPKHTARPGPPGHWPPPPRGYFSPRTRSRAWALGQKGCCRWVVVLGRSRGHSPTVPLPCRDRRAQTLTAGDVAPDPGRRSRVPQPRHPSHSSRISLLLGSSLDDGVAADLLGPVSDLGGKGHWGLCAWRPEGTLEPCFAPTCRGTNLQGLSTWGNQGPRMHRAA